ncbi:nudC domain-containing protein 2-like [Haliotis rufescens]|uniref:nudC domain-containing protein 2-like n=1 Tax=Haliotis rufescens TaxID=6454 RepID=UPI00201F4DD8|nr:nudC domain-containing protein 2-like [Haliotis rufescens]
MSDFDDKSGVVPCKTSWGQWWQTIDEVFIEVDVPKDTKSREIKCEIKPNSIRVAVKENTIINGYLAETVKADDSLWTLEDRRLMRICLVKCHATAADCWKSLIRGQYEVDPLTLSEMEKKLTLQRFQMENPGFDFSGAEVTGNYSGGGPQLSAS